MMAEDPTPAQDDLLARLRTRGITDEDVLRAIRRVPRHRFVEPDLIEMAYDDRPLPNSHSPPLPQPYVTALAASAVASGNRRRVLEVGTDSGYVVAVLAELFDEAYSVERHKDVAERARRLLERLGVHINLRHGDGGEGWPEHAPFDAILVMAGAKEPPPTLLRQLADGGTLVVPIGTEPVTQRLMAYTKTAHGLEERDMGPVTFVPLIGAGGWGQEYSVQPVVRSGAASAEQLRFAAHRFDEVSEEAVAPILDDIGDARVVLLGAATHGTAEFQRMRAQLTLELVRKKGFDVVAFDTDWDYGVRINRFGQPPGPDDEASALDASVPWAWHHQELLEFLAQLRGLNADRPPSSRAHCYGLDLFAAAHATHELLAHAEGGRRADAAAFDDVVAVAKMSNPRSDDAPEPHPVSAAEAHAVTRLQNLLEKRVGTATAGADGAPLLSRSARDETIRRGGRFYAALARGDASTWLLRDEQLTQTLEYLLERHGDEARVVVWAHNVHVGDGRATDLTSHRLRNFGQAVKERHSHQAYSLGMGTYEGDVLAAARPLDAGRVYPLPTAEGEGVELSCHATQLPSFFVSLSNPRLGYLASTQPQRVVGGADAEHDQLLQHYYQTHVATQFDGYVWFDRSTAATPATADGNPRSPTHVSASAR